MTYDAIIIGAGHNGLVTTALLAMSGKKVLVLERRASPGGLASTEEVFPGFKINTGLDDAGLFRDEIVQALDLKRHGLEFIESPVAVFSPQLNDGALTLWHDAKRNQEEIGRFSQTDAERFPSFIRLMAKLTEPLRHLMLLTPPSVAQQSFEDLLSWLKTGIRLKNLGKRDMMQFLRVLPMSVKEFLDEWFESEALKAVLGACGVTGNMQGPYASGTAFMMLYNYLGEENGGFKSSGFVRGGMGVLSAALAKAAKNHGAELRTNVEVIRILIADHKAKGVVLQNGEEISARAVISNLDPRRTFFDLVGAPNFGVDFVRRVRNIRYRSTTAKINLVLDDLPRFRNAPKGREHLSGHILICPSLEYLEHAFDDAKYGRFSQKPLLDIVIPTILDPSLAPAGKHVMSITMQYAPYKLREGDWDANCEPLAECVLNTVEQYAPGFREVVLHRQVITPRDWERDYSLTAGDLFHGQMALDQLLFMRPIPGFGKYRTPIEGLYLCGSGTHPGGGVTGAPGWNAARDILKNL